MMRHCVNHMMKEIRETGWGIELILFGPLSAASVRPLYNWNTKLTGPSDALFTPPRLVGSPGVYAGLPAGETR